MQDKKQLSSSQIERNPNGQKTYSQAARVQGILRTLGARHGITIGELAEEFGVTKGTLYRNLKALEEVGNPLTSETVDGT